MKKKKTGLMSDLIKHCEIIHLSSDENLIYLKKIIENEMKDRKLKISSDYDIRPKHSWVYRFVKKFGY